MSTEQSTSIPNDVLDAVEQALTRAASVTLTLGPALSEPYPDDPRWSPKTRFLDPMGQRALEAKRALRLARERCS